jgi:hypothetical protein
MEGASQELISRQQSKINDLLKTATAKSELLNSVYKANIEKLRRYDIPQETSILSHQASRDTLKSYKTGRGKTDSQTFTNRDQLDSLSMSMGSNTMRENKLGSGSKKNSKSPTWGDISKDLGSHNKSFSPDKVNLSPEHPRAMVLSPSNQELMNTYKRGIDFYIFLFEKGRMKL